MRQLLFALCLILPCSIALAEDPAIVVIRVASLVDLESDRQALQEVGGSFARRFDPAQELFHAAGIPRGPWLDEQRPLWAIMTQSRLMAANDKFVGLLPVRDMDAALRAMGDAQGEADESGIVTYVSGGETTRFVRIERDYLTVGASAEGVKAVDRSRLESMGLPRGTFAVDVDLVPLTPMAELAFAGQRQAMQQQMDQMREQMEQDGDSTEGVEAAQQMAAASMTFGQDAALGLMRNVSHAQFSVERREEQVLFHLHLLPRPSSGLESIIEAQPLDFPLLARAMPDVDADIKSVTNVEYTEELQQTLAFITEFYGSAIGRWTGAMGGEMDWLSQMLDDQASLSQEQLRCMRGDGAFVNDIGSRSIAVYGTKKDSGCDEIHRRGLEKMREMLGPGGEPLMQVTETAMIYQGASVARTELRTDVLEQLAGGEAQEAVRAMLQQLGAATSSLHAEVEGVSVTVSGATSDEDFKATVDRLSSRKKKGGLSPEAFAPFAAGAGFYVSLDMPPGGFAAMFTGGSAAPEPQGDSTRMVFAARAIDGRLALGAALPLTMFEGLMQQDAAQIEAGVPADFWPPPAEATASDEVAPASVEETLAGNESSGEPALIAGENGVTNPQLVDRVDPEYPEWMRVSNLEGRVILQATLRKNGTPYDVSLLSCSGRVGTETEFRPNLSHESDFCQVMYASATEAVEQWRYEPATKDGEAVEVHFTVVVNFLFN